MSGCDARSCALGDGFTSLGRRRQAQVVEFLGISEAELGTVAVMIGWLLIDVIDVINVTIRCYRCFVLLNVINALYCGVWGY